MRPYGIGTITLLAVITVAAPSQAQVVFTNFGPGFSYDTTFGLPVTGANCNSGLEPSNSIAEQFQPLVSSNLKDVVLPLGLQSFGGSQQVLVSLAADNSGLPGAILEGPLTVKLNSLNPELFTVNSRIYPFLDSSKFYWLILEPADANTCAFWYNNSIGQVDLVFNLAFNSAPPTAWALDAIGFGEDPLPAFQLDGGAGIYQIGYAANLGAGDSIFNLTNAGTVGGSDPGGDICANVYVFDEAQELIGCCSCPLTPNHLKTLSAESDLILNTLTPGIPSSISVAFIGSIACDAAIVSSGNVVPGLVGWGTTLHSLSAGHYGVTETRLRDAQLSASELAKLTSFCAFIEANGSHFGICASCREGAQGAASK